MPSVWSSQGIVLASAVAVSGTMVLLLLCRDKETFLENTIGSQDSAGGSPEKSGRVLRSCLSSGKKDGRKMKKVRFSGDVKDSKVKNDKYREGEREMMMHKHVSYGTQRMLCNDGLVNKNFKMLMEFSN